METWGAKDGHEMHIDGSERVLWTLTSVCTGESTFLRPGNPLPWPFSGFGVVVLDIGHRLCGAAVSLGLTIESRHPRGVRLVPIYRVSARPSYIAPPPSSSHVVLPELEPAFVPRNPARSLIHHGLGGGDNISSTVVWDSTDSLAAKSTGISSISSALEIIPPPGFPLRLTTRLVLCHLGASSALVPHLAGTLRRPTLAARDHPFLS
ncbi:hypothetical protein B0H19DRAFT_312293 [Mycena capillaripes]|nr:hypothetical protein B0H19DRAFT_312293 [Mycena capillaripes]